MMASSLAWVGRSRCDMNGPRTPGMARHGANPIGPSRTKRRRMSGAQIAQFIAIQPPIDPPTMSALVTPSAVNTSSSHAL
jgi:hypothetical protein